MRLLKYEFNIIVILILCVALITGCTPDSETQARDVVQKYFDALKAGDTEGATKCFTPAVQESYQTAKEFGGILSESLLKIDLSVFMNSILGYFNEDAYQSYGFKATDAVLSDDEHAVVTVEVYIEGKLNQTTEIKAVKYQDEWYVEE